MRISGNTMDVEFDQTNTSKMARTQKNKATSFHLGMTKDDSTGELCS